MFEIRNEFAQKLLLVVNMFSVILKPLLTNILRIIRTLYQQYQLLTNGLPNAYANRWRITVFTTFAECTEALRIAPLTEWGMFFRTCIFEFRGWIVTI